jgi:hypothetical protein
MSRRGASARASEWFLGEIRVERISPVAMVGKWFA